MDYSNYSGIPHRGYKESVQRAAQYTKENSDDIVVKGTVGTATFATIRNSSKITNKAVKLVQESKTLQAANKAKILKIFQRGKFFRNPIVQKIAGPLAGFAALSTVAGSAAKIADTCNYISNTRDIAQA